MSDFSDIDGGEEPLFAEYEDEDLADPPPLPPPLAILNAVERDPSSLDNIGVGDDDGGFNFDQPFDTSRNESHDQSSSAAPAAKKRRPILTFNEGKLTSPKGLQAIVTDFPEVKFKGKGHERNDLKLLINNYEEWANRLFPRLAFDDFIERAEKLGAKKEVKALVNQLRNGTTPLDDEVMLQDEDQVPTAADHTSDTGRTADEDLVKGDDNCDLPGDDIMSDNDDDHHGDDDIPTNTITTSAEQGMVNDDDHHGDDDEVASDNEVAANVAINDDAMEDDQMKITVDDDDQVKTTGDDNDHQVKTTSDDEAPSLIVGSENFDQDNSSCHDNKTSNKDIFSATPTDQSGDPSVDIEDTPTDATEEIFHNSVDKLFNDISVDELFDDNV